MASLRQGWNTEELKLADIDTYLVKPVKQSRLFDCLVNTMSKAPVRVAVAKSDLPAGSKQSLQLVSPVGKTLILLAEDNRVNQMIAVGFLRKLGYDAVIVGNGLAVLEALKSIAYESF